MCYYNSLYFLSECGILSRVFNLLNESRQVRREKKRMHHMKNVGKEIFFLAGRKVIHCCVLKQILMERKWCFCDYCIKAGTSSDRNSYIKGCGSLRLESIKSHEACNMHLFAAKQTEEWAKTQTEAPALRAQLSLNKLAMDRLKNIIFECLCTQHSRSSSTGLQMDDWSRCCQRS